MLNEHLENVKESLREQLSEQLESQIQNLNLQKEQAIMKLRDQCLSGGMKDQEKSRLAKKVESKL